MPASVRAVETDDRRLAWALTPDGTALVATATALHAGSLRLPWQQVERVGWEPPVLTVAEVAEVEGAGAVHHWELAEDAHLAQTVRACVTSSVGWSDQRKVGNGSVRLVGRRIPGQELLTWQVVWAPGTDSHDPVTVAQVDAWVLELRKTIG